MHLLQMRTEYQRSGIWEMLRWVLHRQRVCTDEAEDAPKTLLFQMLLHTRTNIHIYVHILVCSCHCVGIDYAIKTHNKIASINNYLGICRHVCGGAFKLFCFVFISFCLLIFYCTSCFFFFQLFKAFSFFVVSWWCSVPLTCTITYVRVRATIGNCCIMSASKDARVC